MYLAQERCPSTGDADCGRETRAMRKRQGDFCGEVFCLPPELSCVVGGAVVALLCLSWLGGEVDDRLQLELFIVVLIAIITL
jgi:hypothetical protein